MAAAVPYVVAAVATYGAYESYTTQKQAGKDAKKLAAYNAQMQKEESEEMARRQKKADLQQEAQARARAAASGVKSSGSVSEYLDEMEEENKRNVNWILRSGSKQAYATMLQGSYANKQAQGQAKAGLARDIGSLYSFGSSQPGGQGWWT